MSIKPTIEGIFEKIQSCLEHYSEDTKDQHTHTIEGYAKLISNLLKYAET